MKHWKCQKLGELTTVISSGATPLGGSENYQASGPVMFIRSQNVLMNRLELGGAAYVSDEVDRQLARTRVQVGDVLLNITGASIGRVAVFDLNGRRANVNQHVCVIRPKQRQLCGRFLSRYIATPKFQSHIERIQAGGTRQALNFSQISGFDIPLPPIEEQRRIARILDTADALRLKRRLALQKLDSLTQSIFLEMFGDPAANAMDWNIAQLGDVCDVRDGTHESPKYVDQGFPLVTSKNLTSGKVDLSDVQLISEKDFEAINRRSKVDEGDILMPMIGTIGSPVIVGKNPRFAIKNVALIKFKSDSPRNCFVHAFLSSDHFNRHVKSGNRGGTQKFLSLGDIRRIPVPIPPSALQVKFDEAMSKLDEVRARFHLNDSMLERTWASIQHRAFRGEL